MNNLVVSVVGSSFGDEGKAKIVDYLSSRFDYVVRYQGGDNAGHSLYIDGKSYVFQLIPSGILQTKTLISHGVVFNPEHFVDEISRIEKLFSLKERIYISNHVHIVGDWNITFDKLLEDIRKNESIGTTKKGIGPAYSFKALRLGIRAKDLLNKNKLRNSIYLISCLCNPLFKHYGYPELNVDECVNKYYSLGEKISSYLVDSWTFLQELIRNKKKILFEGSQGLLLDLDMGTYPFVTSSNIIGSLSSGTGIPIHDCKPLILTVVKAYATRVGNGRFITELIDDPELANFIRETGNEYGSVTKRARRVGWLDLVALKYSVVFSGAKKIALTLVDVLNNLSEIKVCVDYVDNQGNSVNWVESEDVDVTPVYKIFKGWSEDYKNIEKYEDFSQEFRNYVSFIEDFVGIKVKIISYGKDRSEIFERLD